MKLVVATLKELELMWKKIKQKEEKKAQKKKRKKKKEKTAFFVFTKMTVDFCILIVNLASVHIFFS